MVASQLINDPDILSMYDVPTATYISDVTPCATLSNAFRLTHSFVFLTKAWQEAQSLSTGHTS